MPKFVVQRSLYEVRERPSKAYSWAAFIIANIVVEIPYQIFIAIVVWACYYYPVYGANQSSERQGLMLLFVVQFFLFASTFAALVIAALPDAETGGTVATLLFVMILTFNGVLQPPNALPGFWIFMWRVSPLTYLIAGITATGLHQRSIRCSSTELSVFNPPPGSTCGQYMGPYLQTAPGQLYNPNDTQNCGYCQLQNADQYLAMSEICKFYYVMYIIYFLALFFFAKRPMLIQRNRLFSEMEKLGHRLGISRVQHRWHGLYVLHVQSEALQSDDLDKEI
jgi:ABC-type multidrug transport system permease subunit